MLATIAMGTAFALLCGVIAALGLLALLNLAERLTHVRPAATPAPVPSVAAQQQPAGPIAGVPARTTQLSNPTANAVT